MELQAHVNGGQLVALHADAVHGGGERAVVGAGHRELVVITQSLDQTQQRNFSTADSGRVIREKDFHVRAALDRAVDTARSASRH